jgi:hypothetical protein
MAVGGVFRKKDNPVHAESALLEKKGNRRWRVERDMIRIVYFTPQKQVFQKIDKIVRIRRGQYQGAIGHKMFSGTRKE